jgi:hypothetical protein
VYPFFLDLGLDVVMGRSPWVEVRSRRMSDERLREAERKWRETGTVEDEARYLLERVRVGDLTQERLELAAYCGHEGAVAATLRGPGPDALVDWLRGLRSLGQWAWVKAIGTSLSVIVSEWPVSEGRTSVESALAAVETWCRAPGHRIDLSPNPWSASWASPSRYGYQAIWTAVTHLSREALHWPDERAHVLLTPSCPNGVLVTALTAVGAIAEEGHGNTVMLLDAGVQTREVASTLVQTGRLAVETAAQAIANTSRVMYVYEAWDYGQNDCRQRLAQTLVSPG